MTQHNYIFQNILSLLTFPIRKLSLCVTLFSVLAEIGAILLIMVPKPNTSEIVEKVEGPFDGVYIVPIADKTKNNTLPPNSVLSSEYCEEKWKRNQYLASLAANMGAIQFGTLFGWSATSLPYLRKDENLSITTSSEESWISSIIIIGALIAGPLSGWSNEKYGRKTTMVWLTLPTVLGWALIYFAQNVEMIYAGRFITGLAVGSFAIISPIFVAETSDPDIRGKLSVGFDAGIAIGILYIQFIGAFVSWQWQTVSCAVLAIIGHLLLMIVPETPRYLVKKGKIEQAEKALSWLKNTSDLNYIRHEINQLVQFTKTQKQEEASGNPMSFLRLPRVWKPCLVSLMVHLFSSLSFIQPINAYTVDIFLSAGTHLDEFLCTVIFSFVGVVASVVAGLTIDRFGRRILLLLSHALMAIAMGALGLFFYFKKINNGVAPAELQWLPITSLGIYIFAFAGGIGPISYAIQGEILPPEAKGAGSSVITSVKWITAFLTSKFFMDILWLLGEDGGYWSFAGFCLLGGVYVYFFVPETKGKTLEEIQQSYSKEKPNKSIN